MKELTLYDAWLRVKQIATEWRIVRKSNDLTGLQGIREDLSDFLLDVGFLESQIYHIFVTSGQARKECYEDALSRIRTEARTSGEKISVELMKNRANIECRELIREENRAEIDYKNVRTLIGRCDQILHSVSSAVKTILKID
jgi:hypothetical protein